MSENFSIEIVNPEKSFLSKDEVSEVVVPAFEGEIGILKDHISIISFLKPGIIKVFLGTEEEKYFVEDGIVEFKDNSFLVLNKCDLSPAPASFSGLSVSAKTGEGIGLLLEKLKSLATNSSEQKLISERTHKKLESEMKIVSKEAGGADFFEITAQNIRDANQELSEIYGEFDNEKILDQIFNNFCIGK